MLTYSQPSYTLHHIISGYELKYEFMCTRFHDDLVGTRSRVSELDLETFSRSGSERLKQIKIYLIKLENP